MVQRKFAPLPIQFKLPTPTAVSVIDRMASECTRPPVPSGGVIGFLVEP